MHLPRRGAYDRLERPQLLPSVSQDRVQWYWLNRILLDIFWQLRKRFELSMPSKLYAQAARSNVNPDEDWTKDDHTIMLPAQFLKAAGRELEDFELSLIGLTPIYKENLPKTKAEEDALKKLMANPATGMLTFEDGNQFKGLAVDLAIANSCVACHNTHPTSPKRDFKKGDVMGAIVVRFNK